MSQETHVIEHPIDTATVPAEPAPSKQSLVCRLQLELEEQRVLIQQLQATQHRQEITLQQELDKRIQAEQALQKARQTAEAALQMKSDFLANVSHEIRTPLNGMIGAAELLLELSTRSDQREIAGILYRSTANLRNFLDEILNFSKLEADKVELINQTFDLHQCVDDVIDLMAATAETKQIELIYDLSIDTPRFVVGDGVRLRQVLINLLSNAIKFTETGAVALVTQTSAIAPSPDQPHSIYQLRFMIQDTGIGLSPEQIERLFQPYQQAEPMTAITYGGTGLGLKICKQLVELMGGEIWVESQLGHGSNFQFSIPLQVAIALAEANLSLSPSMLQQKRVLIIDDSQTLRNWLIRYTSSWGMQPLVATSETEVHRYLRAGHEFDLALLNLQVRSMDGAEIARRLRQRAPNCPLVLLTTMRWSSSARQFDATVIAKPLKPVTLLSQLLQLFDPSATANLTTTERAIELAPVVQGHLADECPLHILLAEDNIINRRLATRLLERLGYRVDVAGDGHEVVIATGRKTYDVVLMDVEMPNMNGLEATHSIRQQSGQRQVYIVALTAHALANDRQRYLAQGMDDYISKPFQLHDLAEALRRAFRQIHAN